MRKNITTALFCALTFGATQAQEALIQSEDIFVIPGAMTDNGKPVFASLDEENGVETIKIYDENFNVSKTFSHNYSKDTNKSWDEYATVPITGLQQVGINVYSQVLVTPDWDVDLSKIKTGAELARSLNQYYGYDSNTIGGWIGFTDSEGYLSCYRNEDYSFSYPELYGRDYLLEYYRLADDYMLHEVRIEYKPIYDAESVNWEQRGNVSESANYHGLDSFGFENFEGSSVENESIYCSQTLFNDDSSWEIIVPATETKSYQSEPNEDYNSPYYHNYSDGYVRLKRSYGSKAYITGFKVLSENGTEIMTFEWPESFIGWYEMYVIRANGMKYIKICGGGEEYLYSIEKSGTSVKLNEVARRKLANVGDGIIDVNTDGKNGQILLTNMAGSTVDRKTARGETVVRLNTRHLAKGVYNVTLQRDGRTVANEKVLVK